MKQERPKKGDKIMASVEVRGSEQVVDGEVTYIFPNGNVNISVGGMFFTDIPPSKYRKPLHDAQAHG